MKWPGHNLRNAKPGDRRKLADWLLEWELDRALAGEASGDTPAETRVWVQRRARYEDVEPRAGDIRLLEPVRDSAAGASGPLYMALLSTEGRDAMWWVPFGRYSTSALCGEWQTGMRQAPLRVLCFWNARRVDRARVPAGWLVKRLTPRQLADANSVHAAVISDVTLPDRLARRVGPPLVHPADPRHEYMEAERERVDVYIPNQSVLPLTAGEDDGPYVSEWGADSVEWLMAAEGREQYGVAGAVYVTEDGTVVVAVYNAQDREVVRIRVMTVDGFPCLRFDGGHVEAGAGEVSSPITDGIAYADSRLADRLTALVDATGIRTLLRRKFRETTK